MTEVYNHALSPTPPPPVYSPGPGRTSSPQLVTSNYDSYQANSAHNTASVALKPAISMVPPEYGQDMGSQVHIQTHDPNSLSHHQPRRMQPIQTELANQRTPLHDPNRLSPSILPKRKPLDDRSRNISDMSHRRIVSEHVPNTTVIDDAAQMKSTRHVSASFVNNDQQEENFEPLRYHHLGTEDDHIKALDKRASKLTIGTTASNGSGSSDPTKQDQPVAGNLRNSRLGQALQRPDSGFSATSDPRGRTLSPHHSPYLSPARPTSRHSRSPDTRPLSYVDLLNVPYPQNAPSGAENLVNTSLRSVVGNNASLMSTRKTLEMYRANIKKTNDLAVQYEFAIFMVGAAQEEGLEKDNVSEKGSDKPPSTREDLLKEAKQILQKLSDKSYPFAQYYLADGYASGLFNKGREDWDRAYPLFLAASKHGHAEAGYRTALCYEFGWGSRVDAQKAVQFYQHAASKNHPGAMLRLGRACLTGEMGLGQRYREGVRWLTRASESADHQYNQAPYDLGGLHEFGFGADVFKDESYAAQLYTKAADLGHMEANHRLGEAYEYGQLNCPKDPALSIHFYTGAAEQGHAPSQMALCAWYMVGVEGVLDKDEVEAYEWAKRAAEKNLAKAQYTLGYFTEMGIGCRRDPLEANVWYVRAADQGEDRAKHRIAAIRAAASGADPAAASAGATQKGSGEGEKKKRFGIF